MNQMNNLKSLLFLISVLLSGCGLPVNNKPPANFYYLNPDRNLNSIGRTILLELDNDSEFPKISADTTEALAKELRKEQVLGITVVRKNQPQWQNLQLDMDNVYTIEKLSTIRQTLKANAVLMGSVTVFQPYPHMTIGLRLKLVDLTDGELLWALDQIWDTTDKKTKDRINDYYSDHNIFGVGNLREKLGTISSLKFVKFVAYEISETLQPQR